MNKKDEKMKTLFTIPLPFQMTIGLATRRDLGVWSDGQGNYMLVGWLRTKTRLDAATRMKVMILIIGPFGIPISKLYVRR